MVAVLVIDPRKNYRDVLSDALGRWFTVYRAASLVEAAQAWSLHKPEAALASIVQTGDTHGLDLLARFRKGARGRSITLVAYGRPSGQSVSGDRLDQVCRSKGLDGWIAQTLEPQEMQAKVLGILLRLQTLDTHGDVRTIRSSTDSAPTPVLSARRAPPPRVDRIKDLAKTPIGMVDRSWQEEEPSWGEMLRSPANIKNMRRMVRKALTGQAADAALPSRERPLDDTGS